MEEASCSFWIDATVLFTFFVLKGDYIRVKLTIKKSIIINNSLILHS